MDVKLIISIATIILFFILLILKFVDFYIHKGLGEKAQKEWLNASMERFNNNEANIKKLMDDK